MKNKNMAYMMPDELAEYIQSGEAIAIVGSGSVEQHGPHQLLGTDTYFTTIFMDYTAEECGGVVVPIMPFSWIGGLREWPGTIDIRSKNHGNYLESMCLELVTLGFNRIVMINGHGGGREMTFSVAQRVFDKTGVPVFAIYSSNYWFNHPEALKAWQDHGVTEVSAYEPSIAAAGMLHMGFPDACERLLSNAKEEIEMGGDHAETVMPPQLSQIRDLGNISHSYYEERRHSRPSRQINPEAGKAIARLFAKLMAAQIKDYSAYVKGLGL